MRFLDKIISRIKGSSLLKDSFWSVSGSVVGYGLSLLSGILLARQMGTETYGEFGMIKQTLAYISVISTFGLGVTCTRFISRYINKPQIVGSICCSTITISALFSLILGVVLFCLARPLAMFLGSDTLIVPLKITSIIILFNSGFTSGQGMLSGMMQFKFIAIIKFIYGFTMLVMTLVLYKFWGLNGSVIGLLCTFFISTFISYRHILTTTHINIGFRRIWKYCKCLVGFSTPIAIQELFYALLSWTLIALIARYSSFEQLGMYTAAAQWLNVIMFIPTAMRFVALSHLSSSDKDENEHKSILKKIIFITVISVLAPLLVIICASKLIESFYGASFVGLSLVIIVLCSSSVFESIVFVITQEFTSKGQTWIICRSRIIGNICALIATVLLIKVFCISGAISGAIGMCVSSSVIAGLLLLSQYRKVKPQNS